MNAPAGHAQFHLGSTVSYLRFPFSNDPGARRRPDSASASARIASLLFPRSQAAFAFCLALRSRRPRFRLSRLSRSSRSLRSVGLSISEYSPTAAPAALDRLMFSSRNRSQADPPIRQLSQSRGSRACDVTHSQTRNVRQKDSVTLAQQNALPDCRDFRNR